jgi:hypothetical protein
MTTGNATPAFTAITGGSNFTLEPNKSMTVRIISGGSYHAICYRINGGDWVQFGDVENGAHTSGGVIALGQTRGQTRYDRITIQTYDADTVDGLTNNGPSPYLESITAPAGGSKLPIILQLLGA